MPGYTLQIRGCKRKRHQDERSIQSWVEANQAGAKKEMRQLAANKLQKYREKRDFGKTSEPAGTSTSGNPGKSHSIEAQIRSQEKSQEKKNPVFVVQEHHARTLHYDFRLEIGGVLKSWAVPKGIPLKNGEKHLAVETEDHPAEYAKFEGKIPKGQYGAGIVKIWDKGSYRNIRRLSMKESYGQGQIEVNLKGNSLKGNYTLVQTKFNNNPKNWLIIKTRDDKYDFSNG